MEPDAPSQPLDDAGEGVPLGADGRVDLDDERVGAAVRSPDAVAGAVSSDASPADAPHAGQDRAPAGSAALHTEHVTMREIL